MNDQIDYRAVRRRVESSVKKQKHLTNLFLFALNVFLYVLFMLIAYGIYLSGDGASLSDLFAETSNNDSTLGALVMLSTGWFVSLIFHAVTVFMNTKMGEQQLRDKVIARELGKELLHLDAEEEPFEKRKRMLQVADDGELEDPEADEELEMQADRIRRADSSSST